MVVSDPNVVTSCVRAARSAGSSATLGRAGSVGAATEAGV